MAANAASTMLALGCEDGSIHILSLEYDTLDHHRRLERSKSRILSLAWGPPVPPQPKSTKKSFSNPRAGVDGNDESDSDSDEEEDEWKDEWIVAGCSDSSLRKWDVSSGRVLEKMGTDKVRGERTLVWTVAVIGCVFPPYLELPEKEELSVACRIQGWNDHLGRLDGNDKILGLKDMYPVTKFPSPRSGRSLSHHRTCTSYTLSAYASD